MRLVAVSLAGAALFAWPFTGLGLPPEASALTVVLVAVLALIGVEAGNRRLDSRRLALLASIAAIDAALRAAVVIGIAGFSPIFLLILCAGYVLGAAFGFACGATVLLISAVATGGVGSWLPYQMFAAGWVGVAAGMVGTRRAPLPNRWDVAKLAAIGVLSGFGFGVIMDLWDWSFFPHTPSPDCAYQVWFPLRCPVADQLYLETTSASHASTMA